MKMVDDAMAYAMVVMALLLCSVGMYGIIDVGGALIGEPRPWPGAPEALQLTGLVPAYFSPSRGGTGDWGGDGGARHADGVRAAQQEACVLQNPNTAAVASYWVLCVQHCHQRAGHLDPYRRGYAGAARVHSPKHSSHGSILVGGSTERV
jgi:hypothetical protein